MMKYTNSSLVKTVACIKFIFLLCINTTLIFAQDCPVKMRIIDLKGVDNFPQTDDIVVCETVDTLSYLLYSPDATQDLIGVELELSLSTGLEYGGFVESHYTGSDIYELNVSNPSRPKFTIPNIYNGDLFIANIGLTANCAFQTGGVAEVSGVVTFLYQDENGAIFECKQKFSPIGEYNSAIKKPILNTLSVSPVTVEPTDFTTPDCHTITISQDGIKAFVSSFELLIDGVDLVNTLTITDLNIGGTTLPFDYDTLAQQVQATIDGTYFNDGFFNENENIKVEVCYLTQGCITPPDVFFEYTAQAGCNDQICTASSKEGSLTFLPDLAAAPIATSSFGNAGQFCGEPIRYNFTLTSTNTNPEEGLWNDVLLKFNACETNNTEIGNITVNGVALTQGVEWNIVGANAIIDFTQVSTDFDGANIGLEDVDEDGLYDDLPGGNTIEIDVELNVVCGDGVDCAPLNCSIERIEVNGLRNCGQDFQQFADVTPVSFFYGETAFDTNEDIDRNGVLVTEEVDTDPNVWKPTVNGYSFTYDYGTENIEGCSPTGNLYLIVTVTANGARPNDIRYSAGSATYEANGDGDITTIPTTAVAGVTTQDIFDPDSGAKTAVEITIPMGDPSAGTHEYFFNLDYRGQCYPDDYAYLSYTVVEECDGCGAECKIVRSCQSAKSWIDWQGVDCICFIESSIDTLYRTNYGYADKAMTQPLTAAQIPNADLRRFLPGDTMFVRAAYRIRNVEVLQQATRQWVFRIYQRGYLGEGYLDFSQATFGGWYWEDVSAGTGLQEIGIPDCFQQYPDATRDNYYFPSMRLGNFGMDGRTGYSQTNADNFYDNCPTDANINPNYPIESVANYDHYGDNSDVNDGRFQMNVYFTDPEQCPQGSSQDHANNCHTEFLEQFPMEDDDIIYMELTVPVFHNPYYDPTATSDNNNYLWPTAAVYGTAPSCAQTTIAGSCNTSYPYDVHNPGPVNVASNITVSDCDVMVSHNFTLQNPVPTISGTGADTIPWFENEYRPFMAVEYLQLQFPSNLAYLGDATIVDYFDNRTVVPGQYVDDSYGNLTCIDDNGNVCCVAADNSIPASIRFVDNDYYVGESIPFDDGPTLNGLNTLQTGNEWCDIIPLIHKPLDPFPMLSVGGSNDCHWALEYNLRALCPEDIDVNEFQFSAQMAEIYVPNLNVNVWSRADPTKYNNSFELLIDPTVYDLYRDGNRYWGQMIPHPLATNHVARQIITNNFTPDNFTDNSLDYPPLLPTLSQNLIADLANQNEIVEYTVCAADATLGGATHENVSTSIYVPITIALIEVRDNNDVVIPHTVVETTPEGTTYQVDIPDLAPEACVTIKIVSELLFCPIGLDSPVTICMNTTSGCIDSQKRAALSVSGEACSETEACYQYIKEEAEIQAEWHIQPIGEQSLCDTMDFAVRVKNVRPAQLINLDVNWWFPPGLEFVPGSWAFQFPGGLTTFGNIVPIADPIANPTANNANGTAFYYADDADFSPAIHANGLEGISTENATEDENKFIIHFKVATLCEDFVSGTPIRFLAKASDPCEQTVSSDIVESNTIIIKNANPADFAQLLTEADAGSINCGSTTDIVFTALNIAPAGETNSSRMCLTVPTGGLVYTPNSINYLAPAGFEGNPTEEDLGGAIKICIDTPDGIGPGGFFSVGLEVSMTDELPCGTSEVGVEISSYIADQACEELGLDCGVNVLNSVNPIVPIELLPPLNVDDLTVTTACDSEADSVTYNYVSMLSNPGIAYTGDISIEVIRDLDANNIIDDYDPILTSATHNISLNTGATTSINGQLTVAENLACPVFIRLTQETTCQCDLQSYIISEFEPQFFADLGEKQVLCPSEDLTFSVCSDVTEDMFTISPAAGANLSITTDGTLTFSLNDGYGVGDPVTLSLETTTGSCTNTFSTLIYTIEDFTIGPYTPLDMCSNECTRLNLNMAPSWIGNVDIAWSPTDFLDDPTSPEPEICEPTQSTTYTITLTLGEGADACTTQATYQVNVSDPVTENTITGGLVCDGYFYTITAPTGYDDYTWYQVIGGTNNVPIKGGAENFLDVYVAGTFWVEYANANDVCKTSSNQVETTIVPKPDIDPTTDDFCINFANGIDLTSYETAMNVNTLTGDFTWYEDSLTNTAVSTPNSVDVVDGDAYYAVFMDGNGCKDTASVTFTVYPLPILNDQEDTICVDVSDSFDLTAYESGVTSETGTFTWYSNADATTVVADPSTATVADGDVFYVIFQDENTCQDTASLTFTVYELTPEAILDSLGKACLSKNAENFHIIDLNSLITSGPTDGTWNDDDATGGLAGSVFTATSAGIYNFTYTIAGMPQATTDSGCYDNLYTIQVEVKDNCCPDLLTLSTDAGICTGETQAGPVDIIMTHGTQSENFALYYSTDSTLTANDLYAIGNGGATAINTNITSTDPQTTESGVIFPANTDTSVITYTIYYILGDGNSNISDPDCLPMLTTQIDIYPLPVVQDHEFIICANPDNTGDFALTTINDSVDVHTGHIVTYHETQADADNGTNALASPYNAVSATVIYARIETAYGCYRTREVTLTLLPSPILEDANVEECDSGDGTAEFNLSGINKYYPSLEDAQNETNALPVSYISSGEIIYIRVNSTNSCFTIRQVTLIVLPLPTALDAQLPACDDDTGAVDFTLSDANSDIDTTGTATITYYNSQLNALQGINAVASPYNSSGGESLWVRVEDDKGCFNLAQLELILNPLPSIAPANLEACDNGDNTADFVLTDADNMVDVDGGNMVTYHANQSDAEANINVLVSPYTSTATTVYARVTDSNSCYRTDSVVLNILPLPVVVDADLYGCDDGDGNLDFTLTDADALVDTIGGNTITYHSSVLDAQSGLNPLASPYASSGESIYARLEDSKGCFDIATLMLNIVTPPSSIPLTIEACDNGDNTADFDLAMQIPNIDTTGLHTTTFHNSQADADSGANALISPYNTNSTTIYTRVTDQYNCYTTAEITLVVKASPILSNTEISECDRGDGTAEFDLSALGITYYPTLNDAENESNPLPSSYTTANDTIYSRVNNTNDCYVIATVTLTILPLPNALSATFEVCDDGDGTATFDLTDMDAYASNDTAITVSYFTTQLDAFNNTNALASPYTANDGDLLYLRVENVNGCFDLGDISITILNKPLANNASIEQCDLGDGTADFMLTQVDSIANNGTANIVSYHSSLGDAETDINPLVSPYNSAGATLYIRVGNADGCYQIAELTLTILPIPTAANAAETRCDEGGDLTEDFYLTTFDSQVDTTGMYTVTYHATTGDAGAGINPLSEPYPTTGATIYARVENTDGCFVMAEVVLTVNPTPMAAPAAMELCDIDNDGTEDFDLSILDATVDTTGLDEVTYHLTQSDADNGTDPLAIPFASSSTTIYARVANLFGCYTTSEITLTLNPVPEVATTTLEVCDKGDGTGDFVLSAADDDIDVSGGNTITYHASQIDAETAANPLISPYNSANATIYARVENIYGCFDVIPVSLRVSTAPIVENAELRECDDGNGTAEFDLSSSSGSYFPTMTDAENETNTIIASSYNSANDTIYLRVNATNGCYNIAIVNLIVQPMPTAANAELSACDDGDGMIEFDLLDADRLVTTDSNVVITYHESPLDATTGNNALASNLYETASTTIYARVENEFGCFTVAEVNLTVNPLPVINGSSLVLCDEGEGVATFSLPTTEGTNSLTYFASLADAENNINILENPYPSTGGTIYVRSEDRNDCSAIAEVNLEVERLPIAANALLEACDNGDGTADFTLSFADQQVDVNNENTVTYHETQADADAGINPLSSPYNAADRAIIYARVATENDCFATAMLTLSAGEQPELEDMEIRKCDRGDGVALFDVSPTDEGIYYGSLQDAFNENQPLDGTSFVNGSAIVYYRVNTSAGCSSIAQITFTVVPLPIVNSAQLSECTNDTTATVSFDLTQADALVDADSTNRVTYYSSLADATNGNNALPNTYSSLGETIYVRVENPDDCFEVAELELIVTPCPVFCPPKRCVPITITKK